MRKIYTKVKAVMKTLYNRIKPVIVKGIKLICEILRKIILLLSMLAFFIIPFMNSWLDNFTAQCVWYPALAVMVILLIREFVRKDGADSEETVVDHVGK